MLYLCSLFSASLDSVSFCIFTTSSTCIFCFSSLVVSLTYFPALFYLVQRKVFLSQCFCLSTDFLNFKYEFRAFLPQRHSTTCRHFLLANTKQALLIILCASHNLCFPHLTHGFYLLFFCGASFWFFFMFGFFFVFFFIFIIFFLISTNLFFFFFITKIDISYFLIY